MTNNEKLIALHKCYKYLGTQVHDHFMRVCSSKNHKGEFETCPALACEVTRDILKKYEPEEDKQDEIDRDIEKANDLRNLRMREF